LFFPRKIFNWIVSYVTSTKFSTYRIQSITLRSRNFQSKLQKIKILQQSTRKTLLKMEKPKTLRWCSAVISCLYAYNHWFVVHQKCAALRFALGFCLKFPAVFSGYDVHSFFFIPK